MDILLYGIRVLALVVPPVTLGQRIKVTFPLYQFVLARFQEISIEADMVTNTKDKVTLNLYLFVPAVLQVITLEDGMVMCVEDDGNLTRRDRGRAAMGSGLLLIGPGGKMRTRGPGTLGMIRGLAREVETRTGAARVTAEGMVMIREFMRGVHLWRRLGGLPGDLARPPPRGKAPVGHIPAPRPSRRNGPVNAVEVVGPGDMRAKDVRLSG